MIPPPIISLVIAACLHSVHGLYQHQIGTLDWYQKNIGSVIYADIYQSSAIVTTSCAVLAAIDTSTSDLIWRQVLPEQEQILGLLTDDESSSIYMVMGSESDPNLSIWSPSDGSLRAITHSFSSLSNPKTTPSPNKMQLCLTSSLVLAWSSSSIHAFDRKTAQIVYTKASPYQIEMITARDRAVNLIDILSRNGSESLIFESVDQNGAIVHSSEVMLDQNTVIPMRGNRALLLSSSLIQDYINGELHDQMIVDEGRLSQLKSVSILNTNLIELCLHSDTRLILDWQQKAFLSAHTIPESIQSEHCSNSVRLYQSSQKLYLYKGRIVLGSIPFDSTEFGLIQSIHCNSSICLISSSDGSLSCIRFGSDDDISLLWTRFEAIATPIQILLVDRDTDQLLASLDQFPILSDRLAIQYQMLKQTLSDSITWLSKMSLSALFSSENALPFDSSTFGMRKLILILTRTRLFALCSLTGQTIWSRSLIPYQLSPTDFIQLFALPQIALIAGRHALTLDSASGEIINEITYSNNVSTAVDYPLSVSPSSSFVSVYFTSNEIGIYPPQLTESVSTLYPYGYRFNQLDQSENGLEGFHTILSVNEWERNLVWRYAFPSDTAVYGWAASNPKEIALNPVLVTADQVLFKYFNRPIRAMLTASGSTLSLLIVDGQTGQVLYRNEHPRCAERREHCHVTVIENVAVYSFYNSRDMLFNIAMVELFHNGPAKAQSFVFPNGIAALGATESRRGITEKHVIVGMDTGQLYLIPLRLYTASSDPSSQPPMIHVNALHIINYDRAVSRMRFIASSSTELESATIIAAAGLDIFTTRSHPSRPFDLLNSDFNFPLLLATVSAVAIGILISSRMALQKQRTLKWL